VESKIRVILVEDNRDLRESLAEFLNLSGHDAAGVGSGLEFYRVLAESSFSIAVVDLGLPDQCGYVLVEYIRKNTAMGVIILTARGTVEDRIVGYDSGADLYMVKPVDGRELASAIANLAARLGNRVPKGGVTPASDTWRLVRQSWRLLPPAGPAILLTAKEMQFMESLALEAGAAVRRDTLLVALGYRDDEYANRAMDSLVRRLRRKVEEVASVHPPIKTVHAVGYCFSAPIVVS